MLNMSTKPTEQDQRDAIGSKALWLAVIDQAFKDALIVPEWGKARRKRFGNPARKKTKALAWIYSEDFDALCEMIDLSPSWTRKQFEKKKNNSERMSRNALIRSFRRQPERYRTQIH